MRERLKRLQARWRLIRSHGDHLNRRVTVENELLARAAGQKPLPDAEDCRRMAYKLGVPGRLK